jgi:hypothetical protein
MQVATIWGAMIAVFVSHESFAFGCMFLVTALAEFAVLAPTNVWQRTLGKKNARLNRNHEALLTGGASDLTQPQSPVTPSGQPQLLTARKTRCHEPEIVTGYYTMSLGAQLFFLFVSHRSCACIVYTRCIFGATARGSYVDGICHAQFQNLHRSCVVPPHQYNRVPHY